MELLDRMIEKINPHPSDFYFFYMNKKTHQKIFNSDNITEYKGYPVTIHDCEDDCVYFTSENEILNKLQKEIQKRMEEENERMMFAEKLDNNPTGFLNP